MTCAPALCLFLLAVLVAPIVTSDLDNLYRHNVTGTENEPHSREKRFIAYNYDEKRITFPPGTVFVLTPTLLVPFLRNLPDGYTSDMTISLPFKMSFDAFGITDEYNPWGLIPGISIQAGRENPEEEGRENPDGEGGKGEAEQDGKGAGDGGNGPADDYDYGDYPTGASGTGASGGAGHPTGHSGQEGHPTGHAGQGGQPTGHSGQGHSSGPAAEQGGHLSGHSGQGGGHSDGLSGFLAVFGGGGHGGHGGYGGGHGGHGGGEAPNHYYRTARSHEEHQHRRFKRSRANYNPHPLGDRLIMFEMIEDYLGNLGHDGKACLLRAICETNEHPLPYHGLFGEFLQMVFKVSLSPYADDVLPEYLKAEKTGRERGACYEYYKDCKKSLFSTVSKNKYKRPANLKHIKERMEAGDTLRKFGTNSFSGL